jgi:hypothetical protein
MYAMPDLGRPVRGYGHIWAYSVMKLYNIWRDFSMGKCFYCEADTNVEAFRHPRLKEIHPTCEQCQKKLTAFAKERTFFTTSGCIVVPLIILLSIILLFINFKMGKIVLLVSIVLEAIVLFLQGYFVKKANVSK